MSLKMIPGAGKGWTAARALGAGTTVLASKPLAMSMEWESDDEDEDDDDDKDNEEGKGGGEVHPAVGEIENGTGRLVLTLIEKLIGPEEEQKPRVNEKLFRRLQDLCPRSREEVPTGSESITTWKCDSPGLTEVLAEALSRLRKHLASVETAGAAEGPGSGQGPRRKKMKQGHPMDSLAGRLPFIVKLNAIGCYTNCEQLVHAMPCEGGAWPSSASLSASTAADGEGPEEAGEQDQEPENDDDEEEEGELSLDYSRLCGHALYHEASFFNHSCEPNVARYQLGDVAIFRTIRPVPPGKQLTM